MSLPRYKLLAIIEQFNKDHPPGSQVIVNYQGLEQAMTVTDPPIIMGESIKIRVKEKIGFIDLKRVTIYQHIYYTALTAD